MIIKNLPTPLEKFQSLFPVTLLITQVQGFTYIFDPKSMAKSQKLFPNMEFSVADLNMSLL